MPHTQTITSPPVNLLERWTRTSATVLAQPAGYYWVRFSSPVHPRTHIVRKDKTCACILGPDCPAVSAVADYLRRGGERAPEPNPQHLIPVTCPICGGQVKFEPRLCSPTRGAGWVCLTIAPNEISNWPVHYRCPGETHYWQFMWAELARTLKEKKS